MAFVSGQHTWVGAKGNASKTNHKGFLVLYISEEAMAPHSSTLAWKVPWTEEPGRLQSMGSRRVRHLWATSLLLFTFHFHALEKEMATHSSVLAWRIPGTGEPGGLPFMGSHRVGHDWSDLAAAVLYINTLLTPGIEWPTLTDIQIQKTVENK